MKKIILIIFLGIFLLIPLKAIAEEDITYLPLANDSNFDIPEPNMITNTIQGEITSNGEFISSDIISARIEGSDTVYVTDVINSYYKLIVQGPEGASVDLFFRGLIVANFKLLNQEEVKTIDIEFEESTDNFPDTDKDGVPDSVDQCPNSPSILVNSAGCGCSEIQCPEDYICENIVDGAAPNRIGALCVFMCYNHRQDIGEVGVDCGGPCVACDNICINKRNECIPESKPDFCRENIDITKNCEVCGCDEGFQCQQNGDCTKTIQLKGLKCKINEYSWFFYPIDCAGIYGEGWVAEYGRKYLKVSVHGVPSLVKKRILGEIEKVISGITVCINTENMGCVLDDVGCWGEEKFKEQLPRVQQLIQFEINRQIKSNVPNWADFFGVNVKIDFIPIGFSIRSEYSCESLTITSETKCKEVINNGQPDKKIDIVFVGDGFFDEEELKSKVLELIDYESEFATTEKEGLFSIEPFKSSKNKFNIWMILGKDKINHTEDTRENSYGKIPVIEDVFKISNFCPQRDYIIVLSKRDYRAFCGLGKPGPCAIPLIGDYQGRVLLHEFGHGFTSLADEYYNYVENKDNPNVLEDFDSFFNTGANCKTNKEEAEQAWSYLESEEAIGYYRTCGGDCDKRCEDYIRPTLNSIMKNPNYNIFNIESCEQLSPLERGNIGNNCFGPPFSPYYAVNEIEIKKELDKY